MSSGEQDKLNGAIDDGAEHRDDDFNAFLNGRGELARQLAALPQPTAPAALDAAILAAVGADLARTPSATSVTAYAAAANDAGTGVARVRRWQLPAGLAASVAGVTGAVWLAWQSAVQPLQPVSPAAAELAAVPKVEAAPASQAAAPYQPPAAKPAPIRKAGPAPAAEARQLATLPPPPPPAPVAAEAPLAYAPAGHPVMPGDSMERRTASAAPDARATAWLALIDNMLKAGLRQDALDEWRRFRLAYPDYPVPEPLTARIRALD